MIQHIIPFKIAPLAPAYRIDVMMYCDKKKGCKKVKEGKRCKKCPGRAKIS